MSVAPTPPSTRVVSRSAINFVLDMITFAKPKDFVDPLLTLAVVQANLAHLMRDPVMQRTYSGFDAAPPDELRRPVSINALAHSLKLPYETARRRVRRMAADGICQISEKGVLVPADSLKSPDHLRRLMGNAMLTRDFYWRLRDMGWLEDLPQPVGDTSDLGAQGVPMRSMARLFTEYLLRLMEMLTTHIGDVVTGVLWVAILGANTEKMPDTVPGSEELDADLSDHYRRPVRVPELATRLGLPQETTRRHCAKLLAEGRIARMPNGYVITAEILSRPHIAQLMRENVLHLHRMFVGLAQVGVIAYWTQEREREDAFRRQGAAASPARI